MFDNEFCKVEFLSDYNAVYLAWKKFACGSDYRKPTLYALDIMKQNDNCTFIIDARNGFEDDKADVEWGFTELLPAMGKTTCTTCIMIMNKVSGIEDEMDMWTAEFSKYFKVIHTTNTKDALNYIRNN